jgi:DNA-binding CsgD family transcriptional regulator
MGRGSIPRISGMLQAWFDCLDVGLLFCDREGKVLWKNRTAASLAKWDRVPSGLLRGAGATLDGIRCKACPREVGGELTGYAVRVQQDVLRAADAGGFLRRRGASARQVELFLAKRTGLKTAAAAADLGMAYKTADHHLEKLYRKMGVHGLTELEALIRGALPRGE